MVEQDPELREMIRQKMIDNLESAGSTVGLGLNRRVKGKRHCVHEVMEPSGVRRCAQYARGPRGGRMQKRAPKRAPKRRGGVLYGDTYCSPQGCGYVGGAYIGGDARNKRAAARNPWLKFLKQFRRQNPGASIQQASMAYRSM